jgi:cysteine desulfurase
MDSQIYLDYNATTPLAPQVAETMAPYLVESYGNPSSLHWAGRQARDAVIAARSQVASLLDCEPGEVVFTSGGTEANNLAIKGVFFRKCVAHEMPHIIISEVEHPAILEPCRFVERLGANVTRIPVDRFGRVNPDDVRRAISPETVLVSIMHGNNEVGTIEPIAEIAAICRARDVLCHTDAAQSVGKISVGLNLLGVDLLTIAGHKLYAPKGVGALLVRKGIELEPLLHGAGHEGGRRAGTENVIQIVGLGVACELARNWIDNRAMRSLRDQFWQLLQEQFGERVVLNGHPELRLPNTLNVSFVGSTGADVLAAIPEVAASTGSACHAGGAEMSPVLKAMGLPDEIGFGAVRFSLGRSTTLDEIESVVAALARNIRVGSRSPRRGSHTSELGQGLARTGIAEFWSNLSPEQIKATVAKRYGQVASSPQDECSFPVGREFAESVGYERAALIPSLRSFWESFTGAGNPHPFVAAMPGESILDLGCGAGLDVYLYTQRVGPTGHVYGLDLSEAMLEKARANLRSQNVTNVTWLHAASDAIPLPDASVDLVTANGIFNLSPDKEAVMREVHRVLRDGGRTVFAEIVLKEDLPRMASHTIDDWFRCIGGALVQEDLLSQLDRNGLQNARVLSLHRNARTIHPLSLCAVIFAEKCP